MSAIWSDSMTDPIEGDTGIKYEVLGAGREDDGSKRMEQIVLRSDTSAKAYDFPRRVKEVVCHHGVWVDKT